MDAGKKNEKRANPRENANFLSALTFWWIMPTFVTGFKRDLDEKDMTETLRTHQSAYLGDKLALAWEKELTKVDKKGRSRGSPSLKMALTRVFGWEVMLYGLILAFVEIGLRMLQPLALGQLISYYRPNQTEISETDAYLYASGVIGCSLANVFVIHPYMMAILHMGMKMRVACCSLIYRKALKLSKTALGETTVGQVVNLLSNDVNRFDIAVIFIHYLWIGPVETVIVTYFLYEQVGVSAIIGVVSMLLFIPLQGYFGKRSSILRLRTAIRTDERVRLMSEIISGIQVIKMYTWEKPFAALVAFARKNEIKSIRATSYIKGILLSFIMFTTRISIFASVLAYVLFGNYITAEKVFVLTSYYNILRQTMTIFFPQGIALVAEALVSVNRLQKFLLYDETELAVEFLRMEREEKANAEKYKQNGTLAEARVVENRDKGIVLKHASAKWHGNVADNTLTDINMTVKPGRLTAIVGPVGAGKSSLLHAILKELPLSEGSVEVNGEVSYASQEPWLFAGSVRQNILFGLPMDRARYKTVVRKCSLERDFQLFPYGDKTIVGERGVSLSGGQRARINLARAVYKQADIYLLDDPLSAVDTHVGKELFEKCITGYLREKTVILITHQLQYLKEVDHLIILNNGAMQAEGTYHELKDSGLDFAQMMEAEEVKEEKDEEKKMLVMRQNSIQSVASMEEKTIEAPAEVEEQRTKGHVSSAVYKAYFGAGGNVCVVFTMFLLFVVAQLLASAGDYFITFWVNLEESRMLKGNGTIYEHEPESFWDFSRNVCIYVFSAISALTVIISFLRSFVFFTTCMRASRHLHDNMFTSLTRATMRFFNTNTSGRILNRFSKDMGAIDEQLPSAMIDVLQIGLQLIGIIVVVGVVNPWLLIPTVGVGFVFYFLRIFYLSTSRSVKRLEGVTRSPVFGHLNASLQGLTTIRAFKAQAILEQEFDNHQDLHSSAWFLFIASSRAFGFWLDLVCIIYIAMVTLSFLVLGGEQFGGNVGLAITQSIALTGMFQWGMRQSTELENQMTSVERVLEYSNLESEPPLESAPDKKPPQSWPERGRVQFQDVYLKYSPDDPPVLRNLNFTIEPKEKVGIVGRTGAGKSSLIAALFQLTETDGAILIDGRNSKDLGLHDLRSKVSIIPQEPVLFSGTMRKNLDPFDEYSDEVLWKALEEVELKQAVADLAGGLNSKMSEGGSNFSVGQRQLVCLARAIVRNNRILVLDEATANVDPQTDTLIQKTIRSKFAECTVLTIAHRLHTVMDSDKVLVMDAGTMVEFDHPHVLLQNKKGFLYNMVQQTGFSMTENLTRIAEENYKSINEE
ncbi:uncharacterized protein CBL_06893 [Carabus blaptoides fortunei]